jgi:hypothetical protein
VAPERTRGLYALKRLRTYWWTAAVVLIVNVGCSLAFDATSLGVKASMAEPAGQNVQGAHFDITKKAFYFFWGFVGAGRPSLEKTLAGQLVDGSEIASLKISVSSRFTDILVMALTGGIVVPRSVTFKGFVVQGRTADDGDQNSSSSR